MILKKNNRLTYIKLASDLYKKVIYNANDKMIYDYMYDCIYYKILTRIWILISYINKKM